VPVERVLFVCVSDAMGGGELHLLRVAQAVARRVETTVAGRPGSRLLDDARGMGIRTAEVALGRKLSRRTVAPNLVRYPLARRRLHELVGRRGSGEWTLLQYKWEELLWGGELTSGPVALWEHGPMPAPLLDFGWTRRRLARAFERAAAVFAWSEPAREAVMRLAGRSADMLAAGVDPDRAAAASRQRAATRKRYLADDDGQPLLVFAGRLADDKGVTDLVRALPAIGDARLVICGDGPARPRVQQLIAELRLDERVRLLGFVRDPLPQLAAADATVLLTRSAGEGRPLAAIESAAVATPVIGLAGSPAMRALAAEGRAVLVEDTGPQSLREGLEAALRRPRRPVGTPTWDDVADRFLGTLERS
jgi:glycosyltransferase involved in cell wall biosynthesis